MNTLPGERVEVCGQRGDKRFAFAGTHFGNSSLVYDYPADKLDMEVPLAEHPSGGFAHDGERIRQYVIERFAGGKPLFEYVCLRFQRGIVHFRIFGGKSFYLLSHRLDLSDLLFTVGSE